MRVLGSIALLFAFVAAIAPAVVLLADESPLGDSALSAASAPAPLWAGDIGHADAEISALRVEMSALEGADSAQMRELKARNQALLEAFNSRLLAIVGIFATAMAMAQWALWAVFCGRICVSGVVFLTPGTLAAAWAVGAAIAAVF